MSNKNERLLDQLTAQLDPDEQMLSTVFGTYSTGRLHTDHDGVFAATDKRLVFHSEKPPRTEVFPYGDISSVESGKNFMGHHISFYASGDKVSMKWIQNQEQAVTEFLDTARSRIAGSAAVDQEPRAVNALSESEQQQKKKKKKKKPKGLRRVAKIAAIVTASVVGFVVLVAVLGAVFGSAGSATASEPAALAQGAAGERGGRADRVAQREAERAAREAQKEAEQRAKQAAREVDKLEKAVAKVFRERLISVEVRESVLEGQWMVTVDFIITRGFRDSQTRTLAEEDMARGYNAVFTSGVPVLEVAIRGNATLANQSGASSLDLAYGTTMRNDVAATIDWKNYRDINMTELWTTFFRIQQLR